MIHLFVLLYGFPKDHHQLTESVLNPADRQNVSSAETMCDAKVTELLDKSVENQNRNQNINIKRYERSHKNEPDNKMIQIIFFRLNHTSLYLLLH